MHRALFNLRRGKDAEVGGGGTLTPAGREKGGARKHVLSEVCRLWQSLWRSSHSGRTTHAYFKDIIDRMTSRWISTSYHCRQAHTGHGNFGSNLREGQIAADESCSCGADNDTVEHFPLECPLFDPQRVALRDVVPAEMWKWPEAAQYNVSSPQEFHNFAGFCERARYQKYFE